MPGARTPFRLRSIALLALTILCPSGIWLGTMWHPAEAAFPGRNGRVAFASNRISAGSPEGDWEIYTIDADGRRLRQLTRNSAQDLDPAWSPDGKRIAFSTTRDGNCEVYSMHVDGSNPTNRSANPAADAFPDWQSN